MCSDYEPDMPEIKVEPYWNVKVFNTWQANIAAAIKVEPYWNVKSKSTLGYTITFQLKQNHIGM